MLGPISNHLPSQKLTGRGAPHRLKRDRRRSGVPAYFFPGRGGRLSAQFGFVLGSISEALRKREPTKLSLFAPLPKRRFRWLSKTVGVAHRVSRPIGPFGTYEATGSIWTRRLLELKECLDGNRQDCEREVRRDFADCGQSRSAVRPFLWLSRVRRRVSQTRRGGPAICEFPP